MWQQGDERRKHAVVLFRVRQVQARLNVELLLRAAVIPSWCLVSAVAAWRLVIQRGTPFAAAVMGLVAAAVAVTVGRRRRISLEQAAVITDRRADAGGLLLTRLEVPVGEWELGLNQRIHALKPVPIEVGKPVAQLVGASVFLIVAMVVPLPVKPTRPVNAAAASIVDELQEKLAAVAREEPTDDAVEQELQRLRDELREGAFDAADWEAADQLSAALDHSAQEAAAELSRAEAAAKALEEALASAQAGEGTTREVEQLEQALLQMSDGAAQNGEEALEQALGREGAKKEGESSASPDGSPQNGSPQNAAGQPRAGQGGPSRAEVSDLRRALQQRQQQLASRYDGQGNGSQSSSSSSGGRGNAPSDKPGAGDKPGSGSASGSGEKPGNGMPGAGHGWAPPNELVFSPRAQLDPDRLSFAPLPQGNGGDPDQMRGLRAANPRPHPVGPASAGTAEVAPGSAAATTRADLLPRNRDVIKRYFDSH